MEEAAFISVKSATGMLRPPYIPMWGYHVDADSVGILGIVFIPWLSNLESSNLSLVKTGSVRCYRHFLSS